MNKTLLLIMCDFMLLNLLALTRWEKAEPTHTQLETAAPRSAANAPAVNADMVELMRVSLEDEKKSREQLAAQLASTQGNLSEREKNLAALQQQKGQLESSLSATQDSAKELEKRFTAATQDAFLSKEQLAKLQRELEEKRAEAERQAAELARAERQNAEARQRIENLNVAVRVSEQEKQLLNQNLTEAKQQVEVERLERAKVQEQTTQLAQGVGQLAEKSGQLTQEIRDNRPVNPNQIFTDFLANRVQSGLTARRPGLFSPTVKDKQAQTILVSDGTRIYALLHISDTPFTLTEVPTDYDQISGRLTHGAATAPVGELQFLRLDPRLAVVPVDPGARGGARRQGLPAGQGALQVPQRRARARRRRPLWRHAVSHRPEQRRLREAGQPDHDAALRRNRAEARRPRVQPDGRSHRHHGQQRLLRGAWQLHPGVHAAHGRQSAARHEHDPLRYPDPLDAAAAEAAIRWGVGA
ncbi:MAG: hypothetical protein WDM96_07450 [Lacunisphaera sp.]